jgi:NAD(P) transhydrogenase subunit alpha
MKIASILENQKIEKRIAITPEIAKKYISLGLEVYYLKIMEVILELKMKSIKN